MGLWLGFAFGAVTGATLRNLLMPILLSLSNHVDEAHLDLHDSAHWKKIGEPEAKPLMFASRLPPPLWRNRLDPCSAAQALEQELAVLITEVDFHHTLYILLISKVRYLMLHGAG